MNRHDLHDYQRFCVDFIKSRPGSMILLDCGLGKTAVSLTAILDLMFDRFEVSKTLVVAPLRVANTVWPEERKSWEHASFLRMAVATGSAGQREAALREDADVVVINRENLVWLTEYLSRHRIPWPFDMVVLDELSSFKNPASKRWRAIRKIRPHVRYIFGLTGTPASNGLMDLWAETYLVDGGKRLGRFIGQYREQFFRPAGLNPYTGVVYSYVPRPGAEEEIYRRLSDISVSMKARDYLRMPDCVMVNHPVTLGAEERKLYDRMKEELLVEMDGEPIEAVNAAVLSGKLMQMANGAIYDADRKPVHIHYRKLDALEDLVEQANGQSVLIAYWFQHDRERIIQRLQACGYSPRDLKSDRDFADWNKGEIPVALISPASAGHGVNIQRGGHILIWFSPVWSLELYQQTNARLWRQGQQSVVTIHHILAKDTIDEAILDALGRKDTTQQALIAAVRATIQER